MNLAYYLPATGSSLRVTTNLFLSKMMCLCLSTCSKHLSESHTTIGLIQWLLFHESPGSTSPGTFMQEHSVICDSMGLRRSG